MTSETALRCAPSIHVVVRSDDEVRIRLPHGPAMRGDGITLAVLEAFSSAKTLQLGISGLRHRFTSVEQWAVLTDRIARLRMNGFLVDPTAANQLASDDARFDSPPVHIRMLNDHARTLAYQQALRQTVSPDDIVLDIGTGTGVLAATAAQCGAAHVYAVERSSMAQVAEQVFDANGLSDRVTVVKGHSRDIELPEQATVLVSEILGNDPLQEGILHITADAIERLLKPGAQLLPCRVDLYANLVSVPSEHLNKHVFREEVTSKWQDLYGLDFTPLVQASRNQPHSFNINTWDTRQWPVLSEPVHLTSIDLRDISRQSVEAICRGTATESGSVTGVLVYFSVDLTESVRLSLDRKNVSPDNHWSSPVWLPGQPVNLQKGAEFELEWRFKATGSEFEIRLC